MHHHIAWTFLTYRVIAFGFVVVIGWLVVGRRVKAPPDEARRTTFTSSWFIPLFFAGFSLCMALTPLVMGVDFLFFENDADIGGHMIRLSVGIFVILFGMFWCFGAKLFGTQAIWPNRLTVGADGIDCRIGGNSRRWAWDEIQDVGIAGGKPDTANVLLSLRHDDPALVRHFRRLHWLPWTKKANVRRVSLGCQWKPVALEMSGQQAVCAAIRLGLDRYKAAQPATTGEAGQPENPVALPSAPRSGPGYPAMTAQESG